jgi:hypothetical protein
MANRYDWQLGVHDINAMIERLDNIQTDISCAAMDMEERTEELEDRIRELKRHPAPTLQMIAEIQDANIELQEIEVHGTRYERAFTAVEEAELAVRNRLRF